MADMEAGFNITIGAVADEASAKKAVQDITKQVLGVLKDGYITIPTAISDEFDKGKASAKLIKAQQDFVNQWKKMSSEGFSSSEDDLKEFVDKFTEFKRLMGKEGKGGSKQNLAIRSLGLNEIIQSYKKATTQLEVELKKVTSKDVKVDSTKKTTKKSGFSQEAIRKAQDAWTKEIKDREKKYKELSEPGPNRLGSTFPRFRSSSINPGNTTDRAIKLSESSPYGSVGAYLEAKHRHEEDEKTAASLVSYINEELAKTAPDGRRTTTEQQSRFLNSAALRKFGESLVNVGKGVEDVTPEDVYKNLVIVLQQWASTGKDVESTFVAIKNMMEAPKSDNPMRRLGSTDGKPKGVGPNDAEMQSTQRIINEALKQVWKSPDLQQQFGFERQFAYTGEEEPTKNTKPTKSTTKSKSHRKSKDLPDENSQYAEREQKILNNPDTAKLVQAISSAQNEITSEVTSVKSTEENQTNFDKIENSAERVADSKEEQTNNEIKSIQQLNTKRGMNSENNTQSLFANLASIKQLFENCPCEKILTIISDNVKTIADNLTKNLIKSLQKEKPIEKSGLPMVIPQSMSKVADETVKKVRAILTPEQEQEKYKIASRKRATSDIEREREQIEKGEYPAQQRSHAVGLSQSLTTAYKDGKVLNAIKKAFGAINIGGNARQISAMNQAEIERLRAQRISTFGLARDNDVSSTGDKARIFRRKSLYWGRDIANPFEGLQLTKGIGVDSQGITDALQKAIEKNMFTAQTGGILRNAVGAMTGYVGMPSLEKSRAQADAMNQIMADIRNAALTLLQSIQSKETDLRGLEARGDAKFDQSGNLISGTSEAKTIFADMEEQKLALQGVLAEANMVEDVVARTGGDLNQIFKTLGFVAPELRKDNTIIQNINAGLNKSGKALKFQTRTGEVMNYTLKLMARHVGQIWKNWLLQLNPLTQIKKLFSDFTSYDVKWQRTMNVIKYNLRRIVRPMMEWIAQQLVNIIGLVNAFAKGIGSIFGKDWDLFNQSAASAEKMREELEQAVNVTAGFDELHDIGSDNSAAGDLMGDIYTPQWQDAYKNIESFGQKIAEIFKGIHDVVKNWNFWNWLAIGAGALAGFLILKWILSKFGKGSNPLQAVANGFQFLEKAVGWSILILSFGAFVKILGEFIDTVGHMKPEEIWQAFGVLAASLGVLTVAIGLLMGAAKLFGTDFLALLGIAAIVAAFSLLTATFAYFFDTVKDIENIWELFGLLAASITLVSVAVGVLAAVFTGLVTTGIGAIAVALLALVLAAIASVIAALSLLVNAITNLVKVVAENSDEIIKIMNAAGEIIQKIITTISESISRVIETIGNAIVKVIETIANGIKTVLEPMLTFIDSIIGKILELATTIAHEIGETIQTVVKTTGDIIIGIIHELLNAIPNLLDAILRFIGGVGPALETSCDAIMRTITKLINFVVSGIEYLVNTLLIGSINKAISTVTLGIVSNPIGYISIPKFVPQYEKGTNYVPNDGLAYLHQGEAVIPKKYNQPFTTDNSNLENAVYDLARQVEQIGAKIEDGIAVKGQFIQRGSDLVATVEKANNKLSNNILNNKVYAR